MANVIHIKHLHRVLFLTSIYLIPSCITNENTLLNFDNIITPSELELIYEDLDDNLGVIINIEVMDSLLVLRHGLDDYFFSFLNHTSGNLITRWGKVGKGPNEYISISSDISIVENNIVFANNHKKGVDYIPIPDILLTPDSVEIIREAYEYDKSHRPRQVALVGNKKVFVGSFDVGNFMITDSAGCIIPHPFDYVFDLGEVKGIYRGSAFQAKVRSNLDTKFAIRILSTDLFEIYELNGNTVERIYSSDYKSIPPAVQIPGRANNYGLKKADYPAGIVKMTVSNEFICLLYSDLPYKESKQKDLSSNELLFFDWEGNKIAKYVLPFQVSNICLDDKYVYTVRYNNEIMQIHKLSINNIKRL